MSIRRLRAARAQAFVLAGVTVCAAIGGCGSSVGPAFDFLPPSGQGALGGSAGDGRVVAVVDGGIADSHPSLEGRVIGRWVADGLDTTPSDHGTMVAGIVAGDAADDFPGGLAPAARLLDAHALDATGTGDPADIASAVRWAVEQGADIIVAAFGSETDHPEIRDAVAEAVAARAVVIASAGNGAGAFEFYPAALGGVVAVTAVGRDGEGMHLVNPRADVAAPGQSIPAPAAAGGYAPSSGTSTAAAVAAGIAAACWDHEELLGNAEDTESGWPGEVASVSGAKVPLLACQPDRTT